MLLMTLNNAHTCTHCWEKPCGSVSLISSFWQLRDNQIIPGTATCIISATFHSWNSSLIEGTAFIVLVTFLLVLFHVQQNQLSQSSLLALLTFLQLPLPVPGKSQVRDCYKRVNWLSLLKWLNNSIKLASKSRSHLEMLGSSIRRHVCYRTKTDEGVTI